MVTGHLKLAVDNAAKASLREAYRYIKDASPQNAEKIRNKILSSLKELLSPSEIRVLRVRHTKMNPLEY